MTYKKVKTMTRKFLMTVCNKDDKEVCRKESKDLCGTLDAIEKWKARGYIVHLYRIDRVELDYD